MAPQENQHPRHVLFLPAFPKADGWVVIELKGAALLPSFSTLGGKGNENLNYCYGKVLPWGEWREAVVGCSSRLTNVSQCSMKERTRESSPKGLLLSSIPLPGGGRAVVASGRGPDGSAEMQSVLSNLLGCCKSHWLELGSFEATAALDFSRSHDFPLMTRVAYKGGAENSASVRSMSPQVRP